MRCALLCFDSWSLTPSDHFNFGNSRNLTSVREKSILWNLMHLSTQKYFDLLGTHIDMALLHSAAIPCISTRDGDSESSMTRTSGYDTGG